MPQRIIEIFDRNVEDTEIFNNIIKEKEVRFYAANSDRL